MLAAVTGTLRQVVSAVAGCRRSNVCADGVTHFIDELMLQELLPLSHADSCLLATSGSHFVGDAALDLLCHASPQRLVVLHARAAHSAVLEMKVAALHAPHDVRTALFSAPSVRLFQQVYATLLRPHLSPFAAKWWDAYGAAFFASPCRPGLRGLAIAAAVAAARVACFGRFMDDIVACRDVLDQRRVYARHRPRIATLAAVLNILRSVQLWLLKAFCAGQQVVPCVPSGAALLVACDTLCSSALINGNNFIAYGALTGRYKPECCPPHLQAQNTEMLRYNQSRLDIRSGNLAPVLSTYPDACFSVLVLGHLMDDVPAHQLAQQWAAVLRAAKPGARIVWYATRSAVLAHLPACIRLQQHAVQSALALVPERIVTSATLYLGVVGNAAQRAAALSSMPPAPALPTTAQEWAHSHGHEQPSGCASLAWGACTLALCVGRAVSRAVCAAVAPCCRSSRAWPPRNSDCVLALEEEEEEGTEALDEEGEGEDFVSDESAADDASSTLPRDGKSR